jgi:hypothetical protein
MAEQPPAESRYRAFLSYSHKDAAAAGRLHRRLEAYRMPRRLVGRATARGPVPDRLWPIFRDREELPAATDLSETVRDALRQSDTLIILCSHHSATSLWVAEEIETFRALHPDRPVLAAILDGDPPDCFPAALRAFGKDGRSHEPLATDLRPSGDGPQLGLLKLIAGITSVGLDDLVQRDAAQKIRRVTAVTAAALVAMLVMAALALVALNARREAELQRADAEGLAGFMLTDLRDRLGSVGRLDIMRDVNRRALAHYDLQINRGDASARPQIQRARILHAIGDDALQQGRFAAALTAFQEARRITAEQLARAPNDPERLFDHAKSEYWIGRVHELREDWPAAQRQYLRFAAATERLIAVAPNNPDYMREVGWSAVNLGNIQLNGRRDYAAAQRLYERALYWFARLARIRPGDVDVLRTQANAYAWLADSYFMRRMWRQSLDARLQQFRIVERLRRAEPENVQIMYRVAIAQRGVARSLAQLGDRRGAMARMFEAYDWSGRLTQFDPRNAEWLLFRAFVGCELYFGDLGRPAGVTRAGLRREILGAAAALRAQNNPRVTEFSNCLNALASG